MTTENKEVVKLPTTLQTDRLILEPMFVSDHGFIYELLNSPGWIEFIGDRQIKTAEDAINQINRINNDPHITYRVARLKNTQQSVGVITFIKRAYLQHFDIGFAMLPQYSGCGYALEGARAVLYEELTKNNHTHIHATVIARNVRSIRLLEKLGLHFEKEITSDNTTVLLYGAEKEHILALMEINGL